MIAGGTPFNITPMQFQARNTHVIREKATNPFHFSVTHFIAHL
jgi:hypothetical protein